MPQDPQLISLQRPEKLSTALQADKPDDCLSCRLTGTHALGDVPNSGFTASLLMVWVLYRLRGAHWTRGL